MKRRSKRTRSLIDAGTAKTSGVTGVGHSEHQHQKHLVTWTRDSARLQTDPRKQKALRWFHSIPNAAGRAGFTGRDGRRLPALSTLARIDEGLTKGVLDLRLDYVTRDADGFIIKPGLVAEMKKIGEKLTPEQEEYAAHAREQGYAVFVWFDWTRAAIDIANYMQLERFAAVYFEYEPDRFKTFTTLEQIRQHAID